MYDYFLYNDHWCIVEEKLDKDFVDVLNNLVMLRR